MKQRTYDPSFALEKDKAEAKAVADAHEAEEQGYAEDERAGLVPHRGQAAAGSEGGAGPLAYGDAEGAPRESALQQEPEASMGTETAIGTDDASMAGCDTECKDTERAGRTPGETLSAGVWDAEPIGHSGRSGVAELERRAGGQEIHPDDIEDES